MNIAVCVKQVPEAGMADRARGAYTLNPADACALEMALEQPDARVTVLTMAPPSAERALRELIARGAAEAVLVSDPAFAGADTYATAYTLRAALARLGGFDLVLCGRRAVDGDTAQTGPELAALMGVPCVTGVTELDARAGTCARETETERQTLRFPLPSVLTVREGCRIRRPPSLAGAKRARCASVRTLNRNDLCLNADECGLRGSKTRVIHTEERELRIRHARILEPSALAEVVRAAIGQNERSGDNAPRNTLLTRTSGNELRNTLDNIAPNTVRSSDEVSRAARSGDNAPRSVLFARTSDEASRAARSSDNAPRSELSARTSDEASRATIQGDNAPRSELSARAADEASRAAIQSDNALLTRTSDNELRNALSARTSDNELRNAFPARTDDDAPQNSLSARMGDDAPRIVGRDENANVEVWAVGGAALVAKAREIAGSGRVTRVRMAESPDDALCARLLAERVRAAAPRAVLFEPTPRNRCVAPYAAALLSCALTADCVDAAFRGGAFVQLRPAYGGSLFAEIRAKTATAMATLRADGGQAEPDAGIEIDAPERASRVAVLSSEPKGSGVRLDAARVVVCGGRGVGSREGFVRLQRFAARIHASLAATRAAVEEGWAGYDRQVGQTGATVAPDLYIAVGVSGAVQHLLGMARSGAVIAVNTDSKASIFQCADFGAVGDWRKIIDDMEERL